MSSGLIWDLLARDQASPTFLRVATAADKAAASTAKAQKGVQNWTAASAKGGAALTKKLTTPLLAIGAISVAQAAKYQSSLNTIAVATDQTTAQMALASKGLLKISGDTGTSITQLTDALYTVEKGGLRGSAALNTVTAAAQGAKAENADLATVTNGLTSIMASYGKSIGTPTQAMNALVRGAGLAKTNLADFTESLSNVVPLASSLHISFAQVAGAIDTMTQHGETAQRATDNLSNLITNLAGQNNVASAALQQLGVNTVSLSKNLGKQGLSGSLNTVLAAIDKHGKDGLIVTSSFKQAATATASLQTELGSMSGVLKTNSQAFADGKISYKDYLAYTKSLGGQQYTLAKNFAATVGTADGFNKQLVSGNSTTKTLASTLQKALGGVTGMRVALMLSGQSAGTFKTDVDAVSKATKDGGKDVVGFGQTAQTASFKWDQAKAKFQAASITLGQSLLPAVTKLAGLFSGAADWFNGLNTGQKKLALFSAGALAAIGPVLSIGSKLSLAGRGITTFTTGAVNQLSRFSSKLALNADSVASGMGKINAALGGAAVGLAVGSLTRNASTSTKWLGALGSAAAGAAIGFGAGGPLGAAIGGVAGGVTSLATSFLGMGSNANNAGDEAVAALQAQNSVAQDLLASLQGVNSAYASNYKSLVSQQVRQQGGYDAARGAGVVPSLVLSAAQGNVLSLTKIQDAYRQAQKTGSSAVGDFQQLFKVLDAVTGGAAQAEQGIIDDANALGKGIVPAKLLAAGFKSLRTELKGWGTSLDATTGLGVHNNEVLRENINYLTKQADAQSKSGKSAASVTAWYENQTGALTKNLQALGFNQHQVGALIASYGHMPKTVTTYLQQKGITTDEIQTLIFKYGQIPTKILTEINKKGVTPAQIQAIINKYDKIPTAKTTTLTTRYATVGAVKGGPSFRAPTTHATGGFIVGPGSGTSDSIPAMLSNGEFVVNAKATAKNLGLLRAINGYASGGIVHSGKDWIFNGTRYASQRAAENAKTRASSAGQSRLLSTVDTSIGNVGSASVAKFSIADVGVARVDKQIRSAVGSLNTAIKDGLQAKYVPALAARIKGLAVLAQKQVSALSAKINKTDVNAVNTALKGTVADTRTALNSLYSDVQKEGRKTAGLRAKGADLLTAQQNYLNGQDKLSTMKDYSSGIASTLSGAFDSTQYGSVNDLLNGFTSATGTNNAYAGELSKLRGEAKGNKSLTAYVNQLASSGQTTTLQTLAAATPAQLAQVSKAVGSYNSSVASGANQATITEYGKSVQDQTSAVLALKTTMDGLSGDLADLAASIGRHAVGASKQTEQQIEDAVRRLNARAKAGAKR